MPKKKGSSRGATASPPALTDETPAEDQSSGHWVDLGNKPREDSQILRIKGGLNERIQDLPPHRLLLAERGTSTAESRGRLTGEECRRETPHSIRESPAESESPNLLGSPRGLSSVLRFQIDHFPLLALSVGAVAASFPPPTP